MFHLSTVDVGYKISANFVQVVIPVCTPFHGFVKIMDGGKFCTETLQPPYEINYVLRVEH
jgi:hypothetical protein